MNTTVTPPKSHVVFEGYDGSGKSSLIEALRGTFQGNLRVIGRKAEPGLADIARILEREDVRPGPHAEMLLRIAVETEREQIISKALLDEDLVVCDRGIVSLVSWFDYLDVSRKPYEDLLQAILNHHRQALTIVCRSDFDTCWNRSSARAQSKQSRKDRLGREVNRRYFAQYEANMQWYANSGADVVFVDTVSTDVEGSMSILVRALQARGFLDFSSSHSS